MHPNSRRLFRTLVAVVAAIVVTAAHAEIRRVPLVAEASSFAFDPATGSLAAVSLESNEVRLYGRAYFEGDSAAVLGPVVVGQSPGHACFKEFDGKRYLAVPCFREAKIFLLDATDLSLARAIQTPTTSNASVASSSNPADPWLYYGYLDDRSERLGRIHLGRMKDDGLLRFLNRDAMRLALSPDGRILYTDSEGACEIAERDGPTDSARFSRIHKTDRRYSSLVADTLGQFAATDAKLLDASLENEFVTFDFTVIGFHPTRPLVVGSRNDTLVVASTNTYRTKATFPIGRPTLNASDDQFQDGKPGREEITQLLDLKPGHSPIPKPVISWSCALARRRSSFRTPNWIPIMNRCFTCNLTCRTFSRSERPPFFP